MPWTCKWITAKKEITILRRNKNELLLKTNINGEKMPINDCYKQTFNVK